MRKCLLCLIMLCAVFATTSAQPKKLKPDDVKVDIKIDTVRVMTIIYSGSEGKDVEPFLSYEQGFAIIENKFIPYDKTKLLTQEELKSYTLRDGKLVSSVQSANIYDKNWKLIPLEKIYDVKYQQK